MSLSKSCSETILANVKRIAHGIFLIEKLLALEPPPRNIYFSQNALVHFRI